MDRYTYAITGQPWALTFGLLSSWTGLIVALWAAYFGLFAGALVGVGAIAANSVTRQLFNAGAGEAVGAFGIFTGALAGAGGSFVAIYSAILYGSFFKVLVSIAAGFLFGLLIIGVAGIFEGDYLRLVRGYRELSKDEVRRIAPLVTNVCNALNIPGRPNIAMADLKIPTAWCHPRHIVLTTALLETLKNDDELSAVLAHELYHWDRGHAIALSFVAACSWPITALYNFACYMGGYKLAESPQERTKSLGQTIIWFLFWPTWLLTRLVIGPAAAARQRKYEYDADYAAKYIGLGDALASALKKLSAFEGGRTGFEAVVAAGHPATELRLNLLRPKQHDDADYVEGQLGIITSRRLKVVALVGACVVAAIIAGGAVLNQARARDKALASYPQTATGAEQSGMTFISQLIDDSANPSAVEGLVDNAVLSSDKYQVMAEYQQLAAGYNTAASGGIHPTLTAHALGCDATLSSGNSIAQVGLHEDFDIHEPPGPEIHLDESALVSLQWTSVGWQVTAFSYRHLGTPGWPTTFQSC